VEDTVADFSNVLAAITSLDLSSRSHQKAFARPREIVATRDSLEALETLAGPETGATRTLYERTEI
jgi:hypothetical protein